MDLIAFLRHGFTGWPWWALVVYTLGTTHLTIASVTIYLHRHQAHRGLDLHWVVSHFFRFWLWLTTGMVTKEWVAIHRKHHAKVETEEDPHSPQTRGIETVFWRGTELYRAEAKNAETLRKYGHGTPDDWLERHVYSRFVWVGVGLMLVIDLALFGVIGLTMWAVQMLWIPVTAAGIINGIGHYWGYRNFETPDASTNIVPWGILIGGEELHNNHHAYGRSAKLSYKPSEFDIGWAYIRLLARCKLATVKEDQVIPHMGLLPGQPVCNEKTVQAVRALHYEILRHWEELVQRLVRQSSETGPDLQRYGKDLRRLWEDKGKNSEELLEHLCAWCRQAQDSGVGALADFASMLQRLYVIR